MEPFAVGQGILYNIHLRYYRCTRLLFLNYSISFGSHISGRCIEVLHRKSEYPLEENFGIWLSCI